MKALAIITARGGSKRIPRKNLRPFLGKPIIQYSIEAARQAGIFETIMVSTDDPEIGELGKRCGAEVPFLRSEATSNDHATTAQVILEVLERYQKDFDKRPEFACCLYPTAPFVTAARLQEGFSRLESSDADGLLTFTRFSFPIWRSFSVVNNKVSFNWPENALKRSQDLPPAYHDCGQFYFVRTERFLRNPSLVTDNTLGLEIPETEVQDIDEESDWKLAEIKYSMLRPCPDISRL